MRKPGSRWLANQPPATIEDWSEVQEIERDILLLYHQLIEYDYIMGDLYYDTVYTLPYWEYVAPTGLEPDRQQFIMEGCLVMVLAMAWDIIDGSGTYIAPYINTCRARVASVTTDDADAQKLIDTVLLSLDIAEHAHAARDIKMLSRQEVHQNRIERTNKADYAASEDELIKLSNWVHKRFVRGYYLNIGRRFTDRSGERDGGGGGGFV